MKYMRKLVWVILPVLLFTTLRYISDDWKTKLKPPAWNVFYNFPRHLITLFGTNFHGYGNGTFACNTPSHWPNVELFLTMPDSMINEFLSQVWYTAQLFWPRPQLNLTIILDQETLNIDQFANKLNSQLSPFCNLNVKYNQKIPYYTKGHDRQQLLMFWADNYTHSDYVGFLDSDTVFVTPVQQEDLFENNKPVVIGLYGKPQNQFYRKVPSNTHFALQKLEVLRCMTYFPVIIKTQHLRNLRKYVEALHKKPFNEVFLSIWRRGPYSQFNIMCNFLWYFHRDEYQWYVQEFKPGWKGKPPKGQVPNDLAKVGIQSQMLYPKPRVSNHWTYRKAGKNTLMDIIRLGQRYACEAVNSTNPVAESQSFRHRCDYNIEVFSFGKYDWAWHKAVCQAFAERQNRQKTCYTKDRLSSICRNVI